MISKLLSTATVVTLGLFSGAIGIPVFAVADTPSAQKPSTNKPGPVDVVGRCRQLVGKQLAGATIDRTDFLAADAAISPSGDKLNTGICQVEARISPVVGSEIKMQVWLPENWNGKFVGVGGGGFNGGLSNAPRSLGRLALEGYAGVATDAGHDVTPDTKWALGNPEKIIDFAHRGNHLGAVVGKAVVAAYYGQLPERTYFKGCSNGGRDALMLAQRYPDDYDAIVAGAPANDWTGLMSWFARNEQVARLSPRVDVLGPKLDLIHNAAIKQCDALDGLKDGLIDRPERCRFDPAKLQCTGKEVSDCLTTQEVGAVRALYRGAYTDDGHQILPGLPIGSEYQWEFWITSQKSQGADFARQFFRNLVYSDPNWDVTRFDVNRDYLFARRQLGPVIDAADPDLRPFLSKGGKLLMYHGWDDAAIPAGNTLNYFRAMRRTVGSAAGDQTRLFMMPGVAHCAGGNGPSFVDYLGALDRWSETGVPPDRLLATKYDSVSKYMTGQPVKVVSTRPVCAWPKVARYEGVGAVNDASSYVCR